MKKVLLLMMAIAMCGIMANAENYEINVGGVEVSSSNYSNITGSAITVTSGCSSGHVTYAPYTNTLTLYNITIERTGTDKYGIHNRGCDNLKIEFIGNCKVTTDDNALKLERATTLEAASGSSTTFSSSSRICANLKSYTYTLSGAGNFRFEAINNGYEAIKGDGRTKTTVYFNGPKITAYSKKRSAISSFKAFFNNGNHLVIEKNGSNASVSGVEMTFFGREEIVSPYKSAYQPENYVNEFSVSYPSTNTPVTDQDIIITDDYVAILDSRFFPDEEFCNWLHSNAGFYKGYINSYDVNNTTTLDVNWSYITNIKGVEYFSQLKTLKCSGGGLTSMPSLPSTVTYLDCSGNHIPTLPELPNNIEYLNVSGNPLTTLSVCNKPKLKTIAADNCIAISSLYAFNNALTSISYSGDTQLKYLYLQNNKLTFISTPNATTINLANNLLTSLPTLWYNLKDLDVSNNKLATLTLSYFSDLQNLNVSNNPLLTSLEVSNTGLSSFNMTGCSALKTLNVPSNKFTSLDLSGCPALTTLNCSSNLLTSLTNIPTSLQSLNCSYNKFSGTFSLTNRSALKKLDIANNPNLTTLNCYSNALTNLYVNDCPAMTKLVCNHNQLTSLGLSGCKALYYLDCEYNKLTSISLAIAGNTSLKEVYLNHNQISSIPTFSNETKSSLEVLGLSDNKLTSFTAQSFTKLWALGLADNPNLTTVTVTNNSALKSFSVGNCPALTTLTCNNNALFSGNTSSGFYFAGSNAIKNFNCSYNQLTALDVSSLSNLTELKCYNNKLTSLNVSNKTKLTELRCNYNELTSLNVQGCSALTYMDCGANKLSSLSVQGCNSLTGLNCCLNQIKESGANTLVNSLRTIPAGSQGNLEFVAPGYTNNGVAEANVITDAQVRAARNKRWIPKKFVNSQWVEIPVSSGAVPGDVNGDGVVTAADVTALYDFMLNNDTTHLVNGDQTGDGEITAADVTAVYTIMLSN